MTEKRQPDQEPSQKKKYDDGDPYKVIRERFMASHPPDKVRELLKKLESMPDGGDVYGNLGRRFTVPQERKENYKSPVGRVDVEANPDVTICAECTHCVPDMAHQGRQQLAYAKCRKTVDAIPDKVNVITGEKISKIPQMDYCSNKNHGECPDWKSKKLVRGLRTGTRSAENLQKILDRMNGKEDVEATVAWEDVRNERVNPWSTTKESIVRFLLAVKSRLPKIKFE